MVRSGAVPATAPCAVPGAQPAARTTRRNPRLEQEMAVVLARSRPTRPGAIAINLGVLVLALVAALLAAATVLERPQAFALAHEALVQEVASGAEVRIAVEEGDTDLVAANRSRNRNRAARSGTAQHTRPPGAGTSCPAPEAAPAAAHPPLERPSPRDLGDYPLLPVAAASAALVRPAVVVGSAGRRGAPAVRARR